jgi:hypothetical protein
MPPKPDGKDTDETGKTTSTATTVVARRMWRGNVLLPIAQSFTKKGKLESGMAELHKAPKLLRGDNSKDDYWSAGKNRLKMREEHLSCSAHPRLLACFVMVILWVKGARVCMVT